MLQHVLIRSKSNNWYFLADLFPISSLLVLPQSKHRCWGGWFYAVGSSWVPYGTMRNVGADHDVCDVSWPWHTGALPWLLWTLRSSELLFPCLSLEKKKKLGNIKMSAGGYWIKGLCLLLPESLSHRLPEAGKELGPGVTMCFPPLYSHPWILAMLKPEVVYQTSLLLLVFTRCR